MDLPIIPGASPSRADAARTRIDQLTKPRGSLGELEELAVRLAALGAIPDGGFRERVVIIGAADHGVVDEGVSAYPREVTAQMVAAFEGGFAAINALARTAQAEVFVVDFGVAGPVPQGDHLISLRIGSGTENLAREAAMTGVELEQCVHYGMLALERILQRRPVQIAALGDMGIGNTTSAAALLASLTGAPVFDVVGRGTGIDDERLLKKQLVVECAVARVARGSAEERIAALGGFEIAGLAGVIIACAARGIPVVLDGLIVSAAALIAATFAPRCVDAMIAAHLSLEPGHAKALAYLGLNPLLRLNLRLGEATGATLALGLCDAAARMYTEMRTFGEAGVATAIDPAAVR